jgi:hypothetical protein
VTFALLKLGFWLLVLVGALVVVATSLTPH